MNNMKIRKLLLIIFACIFLLNRGTYFVQLCVKYRNEFSDDIDFYEQHCLTEKSKAALGRRAYICNEIKTRNNYSFVTNALEHLINDTIYREATTKDIIQITFFVLIFYVLDKVLPRDEENMNIPIYITESKKRV